MEIVYHSTDAFAPVLGTSIVSLLEHNQDVSVIRIWVIEHQISPRNRSYLKQITDSYHRDIIFIPMPDCREAFHLNLQEIKKRWLFDSYCRLFLDRLLPESVNRVLYLDSDVLVVDSLRELWNLQMEGSCVAAVMEGFCEGYHRALGLSERAQYCNSGVILFDMDQWRKRELGAKVTEYVRRQGGYVYFMEQTVFNAILQEEIRILPLRYNVHTKITAFSEEEFMLIRRPVRFYSSEEIAQALKHPAIYHMTSSYCVSPRAWVRGSNHPNAVLYTQYALKTPWKDGAILDDTRNWKKRVFDWFERTIPRRILLPVISVVYNDLRPRRIQRKMLKTRTGKG